MNVFVLTILEWDNGNRQRCLGGVFDNEIRANKAGLWWVANHPSDDFEVAFVVMNVVWKEC
jgi:hypothetical protein